MQIDGMRLKPACLSKDLAVEVFWIETRIVYMERVFLPASNDKNRVIELTHILLPEMKLEVFCINVVPGKLWCICIQQSLSE